MHKCIETCIAVGVLLGLAGPAAAAAPRPDVRIGIGGITSLGSVANAVVMPAARIAVDLPLAQAEAAPHLHVTGDLGALPEGSIDLSDPATFRSLEFALGVSQRLHPKLNFSLYAEAGFASRLPGDVEPRMRTARWANGGLRFGAFGRGWLAVGVGMDQRHTTGAYGPAVALSGALRLYERETGFLKGANVQLVCSAVLGLDVGEAWLPRDSSRDSDLVRVGVLVGR